MTQVTVTRDTQLVMGERTRSGRFVALRLVAAQGRAEHLSMTEGMIRELAMSGTTSGRDDGYGYGTRSPISCW